jgi:hypothetical protein
MFRGRRESGSNGFLRKTVRSNLRQFKNRDVRSDAAYVTACANFEHAVKFQSCGLPPPPRACFPFFAPLAQKLDGLTRAAPDVGTAFCTSALLSQLHHFFLSCS